MSQEYEVFLDNKLIGTAESIDIAAEEQNPYVHSFYTGFAASRNIRVPGFILVWTNTHVFTRGKFVRHTVIARNFRKKCYQ